MDHWPGRDLDPTLKEALAKLLARVHAIILSADWVEPDEPINLGVRQRRPSKRKGSHGK